LVVAALGFCGGVMRLAFVKNLTLGPAILAVLAGTLCAVVFTPMVQSLYEFPVAFENGVSFIIGIGGMSIIGAIYDKWLGFKISRLNLEIQSKLEKTTKDGKDD